MPDPDLILGLTKALIPETPSQPNQQNGRQGGEDPNDPRNKKDKGEDRSGTANRIVAGFANSIEKMVEKKLIELLVKITAPGAFVGGTGPVQAGPDLINLLSQKIANMALAEIPAPPPIPERAPDAERPTPSFPEEIKNQIIEEAVNRSNQT